MRSLQEVFERIEAFKEDMEALGVRVHVGVKQIGVGADTEVAAILQLCVREDIAKLEED